MKIRVILSAAKDLLLVVPLGDTGRFLQEE